MDHRRTTAGKTLTLPGWVIVGSALVCLAAAVFLGALLLGGGDGTDTAGDQPTVTTLPPTTAPATTPTTQPTKTPASEPTTAATTKPPAAAPRNIGVSVLNQTPTPGLARSIAAKVTAAGWQVVGTGNWHGAVPETTAYYPPGFEAQAEQLAKDLDFGRVRPSVSPMKTDRLTLILAGQQ